jgi:hypothetical protein
VTLSAKINLLLMIDEAGSNHKGYEVYSRMELSFAEPKLLCFNVFTLRLSLQTFGLSNKHSLRPRPSIQLPGIVPDLLSELTLLLPSIERATGP